MAGKNLCKVEFT